MRNFSAYWFTFAVFILPISLAAGTLGSAFTYQGELQTAGELTTNDCDFRFTLFDAETDGNPVGNQVEQIAQPVVEGVFTLSLDFGPDVFDGQNRWVGIEVRCPTAVGNYQALSPRQPITAAPYAIRALNGSGAFELDGGNAVFVGGNVGIGTSNPTSILHLRTNTPETAIRLKTTNSWTAELRQTDPSILSLVNGGSEKLSITHNGRYGFNTTSPQAVLHAVGNLDPGLRLEPSSDSGQDTGIAIVGARNASTSVDAAYIDLNDFDSDEGAGTEFSMARIGAGMADVSGQTGFLRFYTANGTGLEERMRIDKVGSVSIGSESGTERLKVAGDVSIGGGTAIGQHDGNSEYLRIRGRVDDWYLGVRDAPTGPEHDFFIGLNDQDFTRFNFDRNGNLGLGTEPAADFHLASTGSQQIWLEADTDNSGESDQPSIVLSQDGGINVSTIGYLDSRNHLSIRTNDSGSGAAHILLEPEGRVGLGTASPQNTLDVHGPGTTAGGESGRVVTRFRNTTANTPTGVSIDALSGEDSVLYFADGGSPEWDVRMIHDTGVFSHPTLNLQYHGSAGIRYIHVAPDNSESAINIYPGSDNSSRLGIISLAWSDVTSYDFTNVSDVRLKQNIRDLEYGIDDIMDLRPVKFEWKAREEDGDHLGLIAQEVLEILPELVESDAMDPEQRLTVNYMALIPVLIKGMQNQQREIESLRARIDSLQSNGRPLANTQIPGSSKAFNRDDFKAPEFTGSE